MYTRLAHLPPDPGQVPPDPDQRAAVRHAAAPFLHLRLDRLDVVRDLGDRHAVQAVRSSAVPERAGGTGLSGHRSPQHNGTVPSEVVTANLSVLLSGLGQALAQPSVFAQLALQLTEQ